MTLDKAETIFFRALNNVLGEPYVLSKSLNKPISSDIIYLNSDYRRMNFQVETEKLFSDVLNELGSDFKFSSQSLVHHIDGMVYQHPQLGTRIIELEEEQHFTAARLLIIKAPYFCNPQIYSQIFHYYLR